MLDNLLVVFGNYNGYRETLNLKKPRLEVTLDSFIEAVPYHKDLNVLLWDTKSTDNSGRIIEEYVQKVDSPTWKATFSETNDFYVGTLNRLVDEYDGQYEYLIVVDNDQYFFQKRDFLTEALSFMEHRPNCVAFPLQSPTREDFLDHYYPYLTRLQRWLRRAPKAVAGVFEDYERLNGGTLVLQGLSARHAPEVEHVTMIDENRGGANFTYPGYPRKHLCWMWFAPSNVLLRMSALREVFRDPAIHPPYTYTSDRLAIFASRMGKMGEAWYFEHGASINFGLRKYAVTERPVDVVALLERYRREPQESLYTKNGYSFFVRDKRVLPDIQAVVSEAAPAAAALL